MKEFKYRNDAPTIIVRMRRDSVTVIILGPDF